MPFNGVISVLRRWKSRPIERMTFTGEGMLNLPVEIWEEIFAIATIASDFNFDTTVIPLSAPPRTMWEKPHILGKPTGSYRAQYECWKTSGPYPTRRRLALVCKSWYFIANPILWSNLRVDLQKPSADIEHIHHALVQNPYLAQHIICLFIRAANRPYDASGLSPRETMKVEQDVRLLDRIIPKLTQLKMISCPIFITERVSWKIRSDIVMLYDSDSRESTKWKWAYGPHFWDSCQTLILTHLCSHSYSSIPSGPAVANGPIFKNLVNLRLRVEHATPVQYITTMWRLPVLRSLSVTSNGIRQWAILFDRVKTTLQNLEIAVDEKDVNLPALSPIVMPRLKALCIRVRAAIWEGDAPIWWVKYITAPRIRHMIIHHIVPNRDQWAFYPLGPYLAECNVPGYMGHIIDTTLTHYRIIQVLTLSIEHGWKSEGGAKGILMDIVHWHDVLRWCSLGITVEAINQRKKRTYLITENDVEGSPLGYEID